MLQVALFLICLAQLIHFSRYWYAMSHAMYVEYSDRRLKSHLNWTIDRRRRGIR